MRIKQGDIYPFDYLLKYADGDSPIDLTNTTVTITVTEDTATEPVVDEQTCTIIDALKGQVRYQWKGTETSTVGMYRIEYHITFSNGSKLTVPSGDVIWLFIIPSLR